MARWILLAAILATAVWLNLGGGPGRAEVLMAVRAAGYPGLLGVAALSGFNLVVPIPIVAFFPLLLEAGLEPVPTVLTIALGMTLGDVIGYVLGRMGREATSPREGRLLPRLEALREGHPLLPYGFLFLYAAFAPIPNELVVIPMAFLRYHPVGMFAVVLGGNLIFNGLAASGLVGFVGWVG